MQTPICPSCCEPIDGQRIPYTSLLNYQEFLVCGECIDHKCEPAAAVAQLSNAAIALLEAFVKENVTAHYAGLYMTLDQLVLARQAAELEARCINEIAPEMPYEDYPDDEPAELDAPRLDDDEAEDAALLHLLDHAARVAKRDHGFSRLEP